MSTIILDRDELNERHFEALRLTSLAALLADGVMNRPTFEGEPDLGGAASLLAELLETHTNELDRMGRPAKAEAA